MNFRIIFQLLVLSLFVACTPKPNSSPETTQEKTESAEAEKEKLKEIISGSGMGAADDGLSPCKNWLTFPKDERDRVMVKHSIYRDVMKNIRQASELKKVKPGRF